MRAAAWGAVCARARIYGRYMRVGPEAVDSSASRALSRRAAQESLVLLKNRNGILPLKTTSLSSSTTGGGGGGGGLKLAFIGPHANSTQALLSNYHGSNSLVNDHSALSAARRRGLTVTYAMGVRICDYPYGHNPGFPNMPCPVGQSANTSGIPAAVALAKAADVPSSSSLCVFNTSTVHSFIHSIILRVRFHIIRKARTENVFTYQSCMVSGFRIIRKPTVFYSSNQQVIFHDTVVKVSKCA